MKAFLKTIDESAWQTVERGWKTHTVEVEGITVDLPVDKWSKAHHKAANGNSKAMNAIFSAVDENIFKPISNCEVAKEA